MELIKGLQVILCKIKNSLIRLNLLSEFNEFPALPLRLTSPRLFNCEDNGTRTHDQK